MFPRFLLLGLLTLAVGARAASLSEAIVLTSQSGDTTEDLVIRHWQTRAQGSTGTESAFEQLAWAYIDKARRSSDAGYYKLAEETANAIEARFGRSDETRLIRGHVLHNLHRFRDAEVIARELVMRRSHPPDLALLSDVLMEQGKVDEAVAVLQRFVNLKPGAEAYSRIAHLRWIKGDLAGATAAMELAVGSTSPAQPSVHAWMLSRLSGYYLQGGDSRRANQAAETALATAPEFAPALLARGKSQLALGHPDIALKALGRAATLNPLPEYQWWLADALKIAGRTADAAALAELISGQGSRSDPRTTALFLATRGEQPATAVKLAAEERLTRQDVFTYDASAWALYAHGDIPAAQAAMTRALAENTKDARLLLHAGLIARQSGQVKAARSYLVEAKSFESSLTPSERRLLDTSLRDGTGTGGASTALLFPAE